MWAELKLVYLWQENTGAPRAGQQLVDPLLWENDSVRSWYRLGRRW